MQDNLENIILNNLLTDDNYFRKVIPFLKTEYFSGSHRILLNKIQEYADKYNSAPTKQALAISIGDDRKITENELPYLEEWLKEDHTSEIEIASACLVGAELYFSA